MLDPFNLCGINHENTDSGSHGCIFENSAVAEPRAIQEAERFMAIPGQALAYKIGQLKIREIRDKAEERLGDDFDVVAFHREVLKDGAMPLTMLEAKIDRWVDSQR